MIEVGPIWDRVFMVGGPGLSHPTDCCVYLVDAGDDLVMIDSGAGPGVGQIVKNVVSIGYSIHQIKEIVATHYHIDHIGGLAFLKGICGCMVIAHERDVEGIELGDARLTAANLYDLDYDPVKVDIILKEEMEMHSFGDLKFHFIHTPGHTPGSIAVYLDLDEGRVLFGQDVHGPFCDEWGSDINQWRRSMEKLLDLEADVLCEGHAAIIKDRAEVSRYIESQLRRYQNL